MKSTVNDFDTSIKNHVATLILHIHSYNRPVVKTLHRTINVTTTEAKLFAIHCRINQAVVIRRVCGQTSGRVRIRTEIGQ